MRWPGGAGAKVGPQARVTRRRGRCKTEKEDEADIWPGDKEEESSYTKKKVYFRRQIRAAGIN